MNVGLLLVRREREERLRQNVARKSTRHIGDIHKIVCYRVAMNEKRNWKRWHCVHWNSMIMQRLSSKPMGRRRGIRGANNMKEQEPSASIKGSIRTVNGHHEMTSTPLHTNGHQHRQWQIQLQCSNLQPIPRIPASQRAIDCGCESTPYHIHDHRS